VFPSQAAERGEPAGVFCERQQQRQRQRCRGQPDGDQPGHAAVPSGEHSSNDLRVSLWSDQLWEHVDVTSRHHLHFFVARASRAHRYRTGTRRRRTRTRWMTAGGSGGCSGGCRRRPGWRWLWLDPWPVCRWRWRGRSNCTDVHLWLTWWDTERKRNRDMNTEQGCVFFVFSMKNWMTQGKDKSLLYVKGGQSENIYLTITCCYSKHNYNCIRDLSLLNRRSVRCYNWMCLTVSGGNPSKELRCWRL